MLLIIHKKFYFIYRFIRMSIFMILHNGNFNCCFCWFHHIAQYLAVHRQLDSKDSDASDKVTGERGVACYHGCEGVTVSFDDVCLALRAVRPSAMREVAIEVPKVRKDFIIRKKYKGENVFISRNTRIDR